MDYKSEQIRLAKTLPYTVDEVVIGKNGKPCKKIITYKDSKGNIIERIFKYKKEPLRNVVYERCENVIGNDEIVTSTTAKEFSLKRNLINLFKSARAEYEDLDLTTLFWKQTKTQTNHVSQNINNGDKIVSIARIKVNSQANIDSSHSFVEYPAIKNGKIQHTKPKSLEFKVDDKYDIVKGSIRAKGVKTPINDSYLGYRALDIDGLKEPVTQRFLRERKIADLGYGIDTDYLPDETSKNVCGMFSDGDILFSRFYNPKSKSRFVQTSRHEVEHGWQYFLDARNGGKRGKFLSELGETYGKITDKKLKKEADNYTKSIDTYVPYYKDYERYRKNYIEIKANEAGAKAMQEYDEQGQIIRDSFKHIPKELL